jgi:hypothetical protein
MFNFLSRTKSINNCHEKKNLKNERVIEIERFSARIKEFGITYQSLTSVKRDEEANRLAMAVLFKILDEPALVKDIFEIKALPLDILSTKCNVSKNFLSIHKEYIVALCILKLECPLLSTFLNF